MIHPALEVNQEQIRPKPVQPELGLSVPPFGGDYARGSRTLPRKIEGPDYARGSRTLPRKIEGPDYARGLRTLPRIAEGPDFARGLRQGQRDKSG